MTATNPHIPRILLVFDFDRALATDSIDAILAAYDMSLHAWERDWEEPLGDGWDDIIRRGQALLNFARDRDRPLSDAVMAAAAAHMDLYPGVMEMPDRLRATVVEMADGIALDFVVLSSGFDEIIAASGIGKAFGRILAGGFHTGPDGAYTCVKRIIGHPEKALYLAALGKGADVDGQNCPERAGDPVAKADMHGPFDQMIYRGDGLSDLQAFAFLTEAGGLAIALDKGGAFDVYDQTEAQRVDDVAPPDYSEGTELLEVLRHAVCACAHRIAIRRRGDGQ
ncbi:MAG: hypothetical protein AAF390_14475 [Pseudomonadota bacterium]